MPHLAHIALVIRDYDEALAFYVGKLGFELVEDNYQPAQDKRWVTIRPPNAPSHATTILLARADTDHPARHIGDQDNGNGATFIHPAPRPAVAAFHINRGVGRLCLPRRLG